jgi:hypothetical protein
MALQHGGVVRISLSSDLQSTSLPLYQELVMVNRLCKVPGDAKVPFPQQNYLLLHMNGNSRHYLLFVILGMGQLHRPHALSHPDNLLILAELFLGFPLMSRKRVKSMRMMK